MKTKAQEIEILRDTVKRLGPDTYTGPWLAAVVGEVESQIRSDYFPSITLTESREKCETLIAEATRKAQSIIEDAELQAKKRIDRADHYVESVLESINNAQYHLTH